MNGEMNGQINEQTDRPTIEHTSSSTVVRGRMKWSKVTFHLAIAVILCQALAHSCPFLVTQRYTRLTDRPMGGGWTVKQLAG